MKDREQLCRNRGKCVKKQKCTALEPESSRDADDPGRRAEDFRDSRVEISGTLTVCVKTLACFVFVMRLAASFPNVR